jgi:hypothetical protein
MEIKGPNHGGKKVNNLLFSTCVWDDGVDEDEDGEGL